MRGKVRISEGFIRDHIEQKCMIAKKAHKCQLGVQIHFHTKLIISLSIAIILHAT